MALLILEARSSFPLGPTTTNLPKETEQFYRALVVGGTRFDATDEHPVADA